MLNRHWTTDSTVSALASTLHAIFFECPRTHNDQFIQRSIIAEHVRNSNTKAFSTTVFETLAFWVFAISFFYEMLNQSLTKLHKFRHTAGFQRDTILEHPNEASH